MNLQIYDTGKCQDNLWLKGAKATGSCTHFTIDNNLLRHQTWTLGDSRLGYVWINTV